MVVLDDVWTFDDADAFSVNAPPARLLLTTRNQEVMVGLWGRGASRRGAFTRRSAQMLADWVGQKSPDRLPPEATDVARECGYLPLALAMIGAMIRFMRAHGVGRTPSFGLQRADLEAIKRMLSRLPVSRSASGN